ncbi:MAG: alpha/beta hydrolase [Saprospiraceae bacterium]|jgi:fermentation-respiration switch protein FrsA (DUF1100 family)|nr:alpha/beta hydrolase [Saprospiraceae bacterium]
MVSLQMYGQQDITGQWNGILDIQGKQVRLVFHIKEDDEKLTATMDSPDQGAKGIPVSSVTFENMVLKFEVSSAGISFNGILGEDNVVKGTFKQSIYSFPLELTKEKVEKKVIAKPQDPLKPYPYRTEDVIFENKYAGINLAGTLTLPQQEGIYPAVILISGSGPQNRDSELLGHRPFLVISDFLTKNGIAVLRFDDRGTGASSGNFQSSTSMDFAQDVEAGLAYLRSRKEIDSGKIGLIGHSEGGLIAPIVASRSKDVAFIVLLAGPGLPGDQILLLQQELISKASGISKSVIDKSQKDNKKAFALISKATNETKLKTDLTNHIVQILDNDPHPQIPAGMSKEEFVNMQVKQLTSPWMRFFITYDPRPTLRKVKCPVLAINGEKDLQVPYKENLSAIRAALKKGKNKSFVIKELARLNHLFQECTTGAPSEYAVIEQTFSPIALRKMLHWMLLQVK